MPDYETSRIPIADAESIICAVLGDLNDELRAKGLPGVPAFTLSQIAGQRMREHISPQQIIEERAAA